MRSQGVIFRCQGKYCHTPNSPYKGRGLCRVCHAQEWRDAHPLTYRQKAAARRRASKAKRRRGRPKKDLSALRHEAYRIARSLSGGSAQGLWWIVWSISTL